METTIPNNVLIVGADLPGLAAAEALRRRGIAVTILEAHDRVAKPWRRRHPALRLNIRRHFARLLSMPPPRADDAYLRRTSVVSYLERYARQIGVPIRFGVTVEAIERDACAWLVRTSAGTFGAAHVIFATGRDSVPHIPDSPGLPDFEGLVLHAADLGDVDRLDGKRVLVVGAGKSGSDVLNDLARRRPAGEPDPKHPGLWFTGYEPQSTGYFDAARIAANRIGDGIAADLQRPDQSFSSSARRNVVTETAKC